MNEQNNLEPIKNYATGIIGMTISMADITNVFQLIGAAAGAVLVCLQLWRTLRK